MKIPLRSSLTKSGRTMTGARALWRANGMKDHQFDEPVIAIVNSFTQLVPGHVHLKDIGQKVKRIIEESGCFAAEFNTIAIDDGIAMGHSGMLYSLPSREIIADSIEYMCNAHRVDAMVCISNCDKITPGMLMAAMRLNIPTVFVSGGPMESGVINGEHYDLVDAIVGGASGQITDEQLAAIERNACPTCGSCSGMFTANSMNCLVEALGLALPGNGTLVATHVNRYGLFELAAKRIVELTYSYYRDGNIAVLPRSIATREAFLNAMSLDIAMGGSTNTVLHLLAIANEAEVDFTLDDIDTLSRKRPVLCKVSPNSRYHIEDVHRAGGVLGILNELHKAGLLYDVPQRVDGLTLTDAMERFDITRSVVSVEAQALFRSSPAHNGRNLEMGSQKSLYSRMDTDRKGGCIRSVEHAYSTDGGLAVLSGNLAPNGAIVKTAGVPQAMLKFTGPARIFDSQDDAVRAILNGVVRAGEVVVIRYEGPKGGPGMQEMLYPTSYLKSKNLHTQCALITDGRFSGGTSGLSIGHISPEAAAGGAIALVRNGDTISIDIPDRKLELLISDRELQRRRQEQVQLKGGYNPSRNREISRALRAYASLVTSADKGAVREIYR